ncbi:hypothetical protein J0X19_12135 [Hymenobacter sp. BT186]|uniref:Uncharacterized protein n=1 Tax=Hymenobacter telluris TaxID=2816474 RepID=A0A939EWI3_9BACT|nr:hypothetical protein [Hymenobacter telluris]MBO0358698.1 hypothetical protein [Hymenobacter telluris]MBW3374724.1 hypothetical protein [Hymenobacter norwichensis]
MQFLRTNKNLLPLVLLAVVSVYTVLQVLTVPVYQDGEAYQRAFTLAHYGAFVALLLNLLAYFFRRQLFKPLLLLTLALTLLGIINFLPDSVKFNFGFGDVGVGFSILGLSLVLLYYFLNKPAAHAFINQHIIPTPTPEKASQRRRESIDQFKKTFARKSDEHLLLMLQGRKVVAAALVAAQELLQERQATTAGNSAG